ncbi:thioredoxin domain-containing protein [Roseofilum sp. Guam]|uniref:thioredoxin domain-containing protein n=1 Tax=Roseofilum sp. Guam TaxID=2821502 RepID=UPI001B18FE6D|nr:thioredoxin domain-containing protein [Roseofilum sp. Guam]MBP0026908.1 thioredoxin fold domain-containing protein [Roseofilum sp. Guam]
MPIETIKQVILGLVLMAVFAYFFLLPKSPALLPSSLTGLQQLKASVQIAVPYRIALNNSLPTVIEFYADWCTTCQAMAPTVWQIEKEYEHKINWVMINIDRPEYTHLIEEYNVQGVPQFIFFNTQQVVQEILIGKIPSSLLVEQVRSLLNFDDTSPNQELR